MEELQPATHKDFKSKRVIAIVGLVLVIALFGYGVAGVLAKHLGVWPFEAKLSPTPTTSNVDMTGWHTYRNAKFGFEFLYPKYWEVGDGRRFLWKVSEAGNEVILSTDFPGEAPFVNIQYDSGSFNGVADAFVNKARQSGTEIINRSAFIFAGHDAKSVTVFEEIGYSSKIIFVSLGNQGTLIVTSLDDQILSTLKFIN